LGVENGVPLLLGVERPHVQSLCHSLDPFMSLLLQVFEIQLSSLYLRVFVERSMKDTPMPFHWEFQAEVRVSLEDGLDLLDAVEHVVVVGRQSIALWDGMGLLTSYWLSGDFLF